MNHNRIQGLSYDKYSLLFLPTVGIETATFRWLHSEVFSKQTPYPLRYVSLPDNSEWMFGTYKPNVSINQWDTPLYYHIRISTPFRVPERKPNHQTQLSDIPNPPPANLKENLTLWLGTDRMECVGGSSFYYV